MADTLRDLDDLGAIRLESLVVENFFIGTVHEIRFNMRAEAHCSVRQQISDELVRWFRELSPDNMFHVSQPLDDGMNRCANYNEVDPLAILDTYVDL